MWLRISEKLKLSSSLCIALLGVSFSVALSGCLPSLDSSSISTQAARATSSVQFGGIQSVDQIRSTSVRVIWESNENAQFYVVYDVTGGAEKVLTTLLAPASSGTIKGLKPKTTYSLAVRLMDKEGLIDTNIASQSFTTLSDAADATKNPGLSITPSIKTLAAGNNFTFKAIGGTPPYSYLIYSGPGSIHVSTGVFTASSTSGTVIIRAIDAAKSSADAIVTIQGTLALSPSTLTLAINNDSEITAAGGVAPYTFSIPTGATFGNLGPCSTPSPTCTRFTAVSSLGAANSGTSVVQIQDSVGNTAQSTITVNRALSLYPSAITIGSSQSQTFLPSYGAPPYTFAVIGSGTITSAGIYTAPTGTGGPYTVQVTDSKNNTTTSAVTVAAFGVFSGISTIDSVSGTSVRLNWAPSATAATYTVYRMNGATQVFVATTNAPASNYTVTGLSPLTAYTFRVRMTDTQGITDTNMQDVGTTTSGVTLTHSGWSNVKSVGAITPVSQSGLSSANAYATITWNAMIPSEGTITSYNIYRATSSGGQNFASPLATGISAATRTYTDSTVSGSTTYYYVVRALVNSIEVTPTVGTHPNEIKIITPPDNMVLVHRWIANQEMCELLQSVTDPANNYRCAYTGLGGTGTHFDIGKSNFVGRYEMGCNYTPPNATAALSCGDSTNGCLGVANPSGSVTGNKDDVYYDRNSGNCYINTSATSGTTWTSGNTSALTSAQRAILASNKPGLPPLVRIDQPRSWETCQAFTDPTFGTKRLLTHKEQILAGAWSSSLTDATISTLEAGTAANGCNSNSASGLTYDTNSIPANLETLPGNTASSIKSVRTGSNFTSNCESRYGAMDMTGNVWEWSSDQLGTCNSTTHVCTGATSTLDTSNTDWNNFPFDGTQGPGGVTITTHLFSSMPNSSTRFLIPLGLPMVTGASASYGSLEIGTSTGQFDPAKFHGDQLWLYTDNSNGTPARGAVGGGSWFYGSGSGRFSLVVNVTPAVTSTSYGLRCSVPSE